MKRILSLIAVMTVLTGTIFARPRAQRPVDDLQRLLAMHQSEMQAFFAGIGDTNAALPAFFTDVSFTGEQQVESFLRNVSASASPGQIYSQVSFTRFVSIGGDMRGVSYSLVNNGGNVTFVKSANINGQMLKAVYEFDARSRKLKTGAFDGKKPIKSSEYSI
ncbi:MAG: hypothetical protein JNJ69_11205 [Leptospiraceae bacterium]|nr:hypothetical protein [Leptospiraceae bacterium]